MYKYKNLKNRYIYILCLTNEYHTYPPQNPMVFWFTIPTERVQASLAVGSYASFVKGIWISPHYCWFRNPVNSPVEVGSFSHYLRRLFVNMPVIAWFQPSRVSLTKAVLRPLLYLEGEKISNGFPLQPRYLQSCQYWFGKMLRSPKKYPPELCKSLCKCTNYIQFIHIYILVILVCKCIYKYRIWPLHQSPMWIKDTSPPEAPKNWRWPITSCLMLTMD